MNAPEKHPIEHNRALLLDLTRYLRQRLEAADVDRFASAACIDAPDRQNPREDGTHPPALLALETRFSLSRFEADLLALAAGVEIDAELAACVRRLQGGDEPRPTAALAFAALEAPHWSALSPERPLLRWHFIHPAPAPLLADQPLAIDRRILHALMGAGHVDSSLELYGTRLTETRHLTPAQQATAGALAAQLKQGPVQLVGGASEDRAGIAGSIARVVYRFGRSLPTAPDALARISRLIEREAALTGFMPLFEVDDVSALKTLVETLDCAFVLSASQPVETSTRHLPILEAHKPDFAERRALWQSAFNNGTADTEALDRLAFEFAFSAHEITEIIRATPEPDPHLLRNRARTRARCDLHGLAIRRTPDTHWSDMALRPGQENALRRIIGMVRTQAQVQEHWGFGHGTGRGLGVTALFTGPSGTGKTLAAEVIAAELELDLLHVDLSGIVSKWIGETEKNLDRIFEAAEHGGALLLFDEADSLFGKRSEVKDSRDRYSNLEVSFLLQRIERFRGPAVLTTNQQNALDDAFLRRIGTVVAFPFPDRRTRSAIWQNIYPDAAPCNGLNSSTLAHLTASGGDIRNIAIGAAYQAAARSQAEREITMKDVNQAAEIEFTKLGRAQGSESGSGS